jgi:hypothetical protein
VGVQDPLLSVIEGIASRGDERAGMLFEEAFENGCRLDSWSEYFKRDVWEALLEKNEALIEEFLCARDANTPLPWTGGGSRISEFYLKNESNRSLTGGITSPCMKNCINQCGSCGKIVEIVQNNIQTKVNSQEAAFTKGKTDPDTHRILFSFTKHNSAVFQPHLGLLEIFSMAFIRAGIPVLYSQGFNPLPRLDIASPLSLGIRAGGEIATIDTNGLFEAEKFRSTLNNFLPDGLKVIEAMNFFIPEGAKKHSVSSLLWGYIYMDENGNPVTVKAAGEKAYRSTRVGTGGSVHELERLSVLARDKKDDAIGISFFDVYRELY